VNEPLIPQLVAHRGYMQRYPENSWVGLSAALAAGACWLEFDVQLCRDGRFVLLHDDNFTRTAGVDTSVFDIDGAGISVSVHEPQRFETRFEPTPVATLDDVLQRLAAWPAVRAMVEIKQESIDRRGLDPVMEKLLAQLVACKTPVHADLVQQRRAANGVGATRIWRLAGCWSDTTTSGATTPARSIRTS